MVQPERVTPRATVLSLSSPGQRMRRRKEHRPRQNIYNLRAADLLAWEVLVDLQREGVSGGLLQAPFNLLLLLSKLDRLA